MTQQLDLYTRRDSWLHRLDPRTKIGLVAASFALLLLNDQTLLMLGYLLVVHILLLHAEVPVTRIAWLWRRMWPVSLTILILWPLFYRSGQPVLFEWWHIRITLPSMLQGFTSALRIDALAFAALVLLVSTDQTRLVQGLVGLGMPYEWGLTIAISLRYLPLLDGTYRTITDAQKARGWSPRRSSLLQRARSYIPTLVALVIAALRLTDALTWALAARGFQPGQPRTSRRPLRLTRADHLGLSVSAILLLFAMALRILAG